MLATRVIPVILCRGRTLVKGKQFNAWRSVGVAAQAVRIQQSRGVDELCLLDIGATPEGRGPDLSLVEELSEVCFMPLAVGGGVKSVEDVRALLAAGADKVVIGTAACESNLVRKAADVVGCQAIIVSIDVKERAVWKCCGKVKMWDNPDGVLRPVQWAREMVSLGAGEILLTAIDREGTLDGYDLDLIREVSAAVDIPVIANGGCGTYEHMRQAIEAGASAVAAGAMFQFTDATPRGAAEYLGAHNIEVRL